jgi:Na+-transporting methylmalonyl-CoA/oxaloacetate decarboxylase gamma subunit
MNRGAGTGLLGLGIVLVVVGAIMRYAITAKATGFDVHQAGIILLLVGIGVCVLSLFIFAFAGKSRSTTRTDVRETPSGQERTEQRDDWSTS